MVEEEKAVEEDDVRLDAGERRRRVERSISIEAAGLPRPRRRRDGQHGACIVRGAVLEGRGELFEEGNRALRRREEESRRGD